ncbi:MAG TPA: RNA-directed DNA polymerase, partial [Methylomirabilota bacterium]|nr:RNA-directed DNA polymerase [Methylomirabilota bacterium]
MTNDLNLLDLGLDWKLALQRVTKDLRDDFWPDPLGFKDVLGSDEAGIRRLEPLLKSYKPRRGASYQVPKVNFTIRDSIYISALDRLVYQALIDRLIVHIDPRLSPGVFSHRLRAPTSKWIFYSGVEQWKKFLDAVKTELHARPKSWLVITDLSQYFETVRFRPLKRQLEEMLGETLTPDLQRCIDALMRCLSVWSPYDGYGLPQNIEASSFLGNVLLDRSDKLMERDGFPIIRYMDDIRLVVPSEADARIALMRLVSYLRDIGLGVNSAKTEVLRPGSKEIQAHLLVEDAEVTAIERAIGTKDRSQVQGIVKVLFGKANRLLESGKVGERIFRFCLNRIATLRAYGNLELPDGNSLTSGVLRLLVERPAETDTFCRYLEVAPLNAEHSAEIERLLILEPLCVYAWQNFQLWSLASQRKIKSDKLVHRAHAAISKDHASPGTAAVALYLGSCGDYVDRQALEKRLSSVPPGLVRRCFLIAIQELNKAERNAAY